MRILIDGMNLALEQGTGVATYSRNLASCARRRGHSLSVLYGKRAPEQGDAVLREAMFIDAQREKRTLGERLSDFSVALPRAFRTARPAVVPETGHVVREGQRLSFPDADGFLNYRGLFETAQLRFNLTGRFLEVALPEPVDVAHWTYPIPIRARGARNVYTLHDLVPLKLPYATLDRKARYWRLVKAIAQTADHVITVSDCSRCDILGMLPIAEERVTNTGQSVDIPRGLLEKSPADVDIELANMFHASGGADRLTREGFYLFVGAIEPKKNLRRIIEGFLASGVPEPLVVVGRKAWQYEDVVTMMARSPRIVYLDYLPFSQMITLMRAARALIFASLYEGFGLPILEAFLCGTPVITATTSSTGEVAGDAALLVDPYDARAIRDAIRSLSAPDSGPLRAGMAERGRRRAAAFDEAQIAERLDACYRRIVAP